MSAYDKISEGLNEAIDVVSGNIPAARINVNGHFYIPEIPWITNKILLSGRKNQDIIELTISLNPEDIDLLPHHFLRYIATAIKDHKGT